MNTVNKQVKYDYIDNLVFEYQNGSENAALELIKEFGYDSEKNETSWLIGKYFGLLRYGTIKFRNKQTRKFISLFASDKKLREDLVPSFQYADTKKQSRIIVQRINNRMAHLTDQEIIHDLSSILLELAQRFKKQSEKKNFCGYVNSCYHLYLFNHYKYLFEDLLYSYRIDPLDDIKDENSEITIKEEWFQDLYFLNETQELGFNWILGRTAEYPFDQLNQFERTILSLYDDKGLTYEEAGAQMGYHRDTIYRNRKSIKDKLHNLIDQKNNSLF